MSVGSEEKSEGQMSNSNVRRPLGIMTDFTFILTPLEILRTNVLLKDKEKYRRARKSQFKRKQIEGIQVISQLGNFRQVSSLPCLLFMGSRIHILPLAFSTPGDICKMHMR